MRKLQPQPSEKSPDPGRCLDAAYRHLSFRPRSVFELRSFLGRKGFDGPTIEQVLEKLKTDSLVDDEAFAEFWKSNRETFSPRGHAALKRELRRKGIEPGIVNRVIEQVDERDGAYRAAEKKVRHLDRSDYHTFHRKLTGFLSRRGFGYEICNSVAHSFWEKRGTDDEE